MKIASKLLCSIWAVTLLVILSFALSVAALAMPVATVAYGGQQQPSNAYDGTSPETFDYDSAVAPPANENTNQTVRMGGAFAKVGEFLAAKGGGQTFEILDGVRRSKAGDLVGNQTIPGQILNAEGKVVGTQNIPISQLLSPKPSIDVSTTVNMNRFMDTLNKTKAGSVPPPITVTPGGRGVPIRDVPLDPLGPN